MTGKMYPFNLLVAIADLVSWVEERNNKYQDHQIINYPPIWDMVRVYFPSVPEFRSLKLISGLSNNNSLT